MKNENNNNNIVTPEKIDLDKVQIDENDTMLNRERRNIVSATIQANGALDAKQARKVNDTIKLKKKNPIVNFLIIAFLLAVAALIAIGAYILVNRIMNYDTPKEEENVTTPVTKNKVESYLASTDKVRKFQASGSFNIGGTIYTDIMLLLAPSGYDLNTNKDYYMIIYSNGDVLSAEYGEYNIVGDKIECVSDNGNNINFTISEEYLNADSITGDFLIKDTEMKYYYYKDDVSANILIVNGTLLGEYAMYISSNSNEKNIIIDRFSETQEAITMNNGTEFVKSGSDIIVNGITLHSAY